jgi:anthranilate synthase component 1
MVTPGLDDASAAYQGGTPIILRATMVGDLETPVSAYLKLTSAGAANTFLLESVEGGAVRGRYSMIGLAPDIIWRCHGAYLNRPDRSNQRTKRQTACGGVCQ